MKESKHAKRHLIRSLLIIAILAAVGSAVLGPYGLAIGVVAGIAWLMWQKKHHATAA